MTRGRVTWAGVLIVAAAAAYPAAQAGRPAAALSPGKVIVYAVAEGTDEAAVVGLTEADFEILSEGVRQPIASFSSAPLPLTVLLIGDLSKSVIDRSRTLQTIWIDPISSAAEHFVRALRAEDRGRLMAMAGSEFQAGPEWTSDRRALEAAARRLVPINARYQPSPIWDAVDLGVPLFERESGRRAIVLVTDGRASGNFADLSEVADRAMIAGVAVSVVELEATPRTLEIVGTPFVPSPTPFLKALAATTGGLYARARVNPLQQHHDPGPLVTSILGRLRTSYTLGFIPSGDGPPVRSIDVRVRRPGVTVHARQGFLKERG